MKLILLSKILSLALSLGCSFQSPQPPEEPGIANAKSANWSVKVMSVKEKRDIDLLYNVGVISVEVRVEYLGPTGNVVAPLVRILYSGGILKNEETAQLSGLTIKAGQEDRENLEMLGWLVTNQPFLSDPTQAQHGSKTLERGKKFGGVLDFKYGRGGEPTSFKLSFGDVPPIPLNVRPSK